MLRLVVNIYPSHNSPPPLGGAPLGRPQLAATQRPPVYPFSTEWWGFVGAQHATPCAVRRIMNRYKKRCCILTHPQGVACCGAKSGRPVVEENRGRVKVNHQGAAYAASCVRSMLRPDKRRGDCI